MSSITLISVWTRTFYRTWLQQLLCHAATLMIHTICSISTLNQQLTNLVETHIRCRLHCERCTVKGRDCASVSHSFKEINYRTDEWTKQLLRLRSWVISGNPQQWMEFRHLWWTVSVFKCSCLFLLFDFFCLLVQYFLFFENLLFFDDFKWELNVYWQTVGKSGKLQNKYTQNLTRCKKFNSKSDACFKKLN